MWRQRTRWWCIVPALAAALVGGCAGERDHIARTAPASPKALSDGRLDRNPTPLSGRDVAAQPKGSARQAVYALWFWAQWGGTPQAVAMYGSRIRRALGDQRIADALTEVRTSLATSSLEVIEAIKSRQGTTILVRERSATAGPTLDSFLLRRQNGDWVVVADTLLQRALGAEARSRAEGPIPARPTRRGVMAAAAAGRRYRSLFPYQSKARREFRPVGRAG
jgi:hypothetical protein